MKIKPSRAAAMVDKNSRTIVKIMQLQEYLTENEKEYTSKDKAVLRRIGKSFFKIHTVSRDCSISSTTAE